MTTRNFAAASAEVASEPITFTVGDSRTFTVPRPVPALPMLELAAASNEDTPDKVAAAFGGYIFGVLPADQHADFRKACADARMDMDGLLELVQWIIEEATGRPTQPPSSSEGRSSTTGMSSSTDSLAEAKAS